MGKLLKVSAELSKFIARGYLIRWSEKNMTQRRHKYLANMKRSASHILSTMNVRIEHVHPERLEQTQAPRLIVCNHMSYLDILVLIETVPALFVTSVELQKTFFLGDIAESGGSLFVERRQPSRLKKDLKAVGEVLRGGFNLVVFPEGTSGNGETVMPFRPGLFTVATELGIPIQPLCIKYLTVNGEPFAPDHRDKICWYGDMKFGPHFKKMTALKEVSAQVHFLEPILVDASSDRRDLCDEAHRRILNCYEGSREGQEPSEILT